MIIRTLCHDVFIERGGYSVVFAATGINRFSLHVVFLVPLFLPLRAHADNLATVPKETDHYHKGKAGKRKMKNKDRKRENGIGDKILANTLYFLTALLILGFFIQSIAPFVLK